MIFAPFGSTFNIESNDTKIIKTRAIIMHCDINSDSVKYRLIPSAIQERIETTEAVRATPTETFADEII